ncbi:hypothetical protein ACSQ67_023019 [Phaseolus vulgaris]
MGCTASKLENEDTVRRCKDRRRLMKDAVYARHQLAAAHSDYCRSLRLTGSALSTFAAGEPLSVSDHTPAVFLNNSQQPPPTIHHTRPPSPPRHHHHHHRHHSPPPFNPSLPPKLAPIQPRRRKQLHPKLPHILSDSSPSSTPRSQVSNFPSNFFPTAHSTYSSTPSQTSSVWNWENFYPPPPPPASDYFPEEQRYQHQHQQKIPEEQRYQHQHQHQQKLSQAQTQTQTPSLHSHKTQTPSHYSHKTQPTNPQIHDSDSERSEYDYFDGKLETQKLTPTLALPLMFTLILTLITIFLRSIPRLRGKRTRSNFGSSMRAQSVAAGGGAKGFDSASSVAEMKMVVRHRDLREIVEAIKENFDNAASAGDQVSEMLEISKAQLDRSFKQLRKTVYHSSSILSNLSSSWTSKPPLAVKYRLDTGSLDEPGGSKSLCSTIERLLAWEKKLYEEVKAREGVKIEHEKKLSALQTQEYKGEDEAKIFKTKTSINRLQSLIVVTSQAVSTTSTAIVGLRDSDLVPQLVALIHGFMYMWKAMHNYHEIQSNVVQQVRGLVNRSSRGDSTSELHRQATRDLEAAVSAWHSSFCRLIKFQREFIFSLHGWFKLSLLPINNDNINNSRDNSDTYHFFDEWKLALDRVPDTVASEAIKSFINVVHVISAKQTEELKIKKRTETTSKELEKKASSLRNLERKYYSSYSMVGISLPDTAPDGQGLDARDPLAEKKLDLATCQRRVEDEMLRHSKAVELTRAMTLNNLQTGLPGVFQALTSFSSLFTEALESVCTRSYAIK